MIVIGSCKLSVYSLCSVLWGKRSEELVFLLEGLEFTVTNLWRGIDEFDFHLLESSIGSLREDWFSKDDGSLSGSNNASLNHDEVVVDFAVVWETTKRSDILFNGVSFSSSVVLNTSVSTSTYSVDLFVLFSSVVITELTSSSDSPLNGSWMPSTDTTNLSETSVSLSWHSSNTESLDNTSSTFTSGNTNSINHLVVIEDFTDGNFIFEFAKSPINLLSNSATVNLDFNEVSLSLSEVELIELSWGKNSNNLTVLLDSLKISLDWFLALLILLPSLGILWEGLLLWLAPVLVESSLNLVGDVLSPDSSESSETSWGFDVTNKTNNFHCWGLNDGNWLNDISLDDLLTFSLFVVSGNVSHTSLVTNEGSEVNWSLYVISWERSDSTSVVSCSSSWQEGEWAWSWAFVLSVRHLGYLPI